MITPTMTPSGKKVYGDATQKVLDLVRVFYRQQEERIKASHGLEHVLRVLDHADRAIAVHQQPVLTASQAQQVQIAALLHDVDDGKYFPQHKNYENARAMLAQCRPELERLYEKEGNDDRGTEDEEKDSASADIAYDMIEKNILSMIGWVSCSHNGNRVPPIVRESSKWHFLIPRWADRLEAVGPIGVVRCFQYNQEHQRPLSSPTSPRARTEAEVWALATPQRFEKYLKGSSSGSSDDDDDDDDMISHYYDKLLHVARPPPDIVRNPYLEQAAQESSRELVQVCLTFGQTGKVDTLAIEQMAATLGMKL